MKSYFYIDKITQQQRGPFTVEQLKTHNVQPDTMVWCSGMDDWAAAGNVEELTCLFAQSPQYQPTVQQQMNRQQNTVRPPYQWQDVNSNGNRQNQDERKFDYLLPMPKNWLIESILATIFCCLPFGIAGIVNATKVESYYYAGDYAAAEKASKNAKKWTMVSVFVSVGLLFLYILLVFFVSIIGAFA